MESQERHDGSHNGHQQQLPQHQSHDSPQSFQEVISSLLMATEELRQSVTKTDDITAKAVLFWKHELEACLHSLFVELPSAANGADGDAAIHADMFNLVFRKVVAAAKLVMDHALQKPELDDHPAKDPTSSTPPPAHDAALERDCQAAVARIVELQFHLMLDPSNPDKPNNTQQRKERIDQIIASYQSYQRLVLRQRAKYAIARLVEYRQQQKESAMHSFANAHHDDDDMDDDDDPYTTSSHVHVATVILGQASALIHPLLMWRSSVPAPPSASNSDSHNGNGNADEDEDVHFIYEMCDKTIDVLDEQAQTLTRTVTTWFYEDKSIDDWMVKSSAFDAQLQQAETLKPQDPSSVIDLDDLDQTVEEMAFIGQLVARYLALIEDQTSTQLTVLSRDVQPEWTWKYALLERYLAMQQWQSALLLANPVSIVVGTNIQVPSVVEDAQYLSTKSLERAASTRSDQAIGTVAHSLSTYVWSTDIVQGGGGVYQALIEQKGCFAESINDDHGDGANNTNDAANNARSNDDVEEKTPPRSGGFAAALMGALRDDGRDKKKNRAAALKSKSSISTASSGSKPSSAPSSGNLLSALSSFGMTGASEKMQQMRLETTLCSLNGIHSASTACIGLVKLLDSLLEEEDDHDSDDGGNNGANGNDDGARDDQRKSKRSGTNNMIQLAREELARYSKTYQQLMESSVQRIVVEWCGKPSDAAVYKGSFCLPVIRYTMEREQYDIFDTNALAAAEDDARLEKILLHPIQHSILLKNLDRCDASILTAICSELASSLVELFLDCIQVTSHNHAIPPKQFTDWGAMLFAKQVRLLQSYLGKAMQKAASSISDIHDDDTQQVAIGHLSQWERLLQVVTVLQLERPSDWSLYQATSILTLEELERAMKLRVDFRKDAIARMVTSLQPKPSEVAPPTMDESRDTMNAASSTAPNMQPAASSRAPPPTMMAAPTAATVAPQIQQTALAPPPVQMMTPPPMYNPATAAAATTTPIQQQQQQQRPPPRPPQAAAPVSSFYSQPPAMRPQQPTTTAGTPSFLPPPPPPPPPAQNGSFLPPPPPPPPQR